MPSDGVHGKPQPGSTQDGPKQRKVSLITVLLPIANLQFTQWCLANYHPQTPNTPLEFKYTLLNPKASSYFKAFNCIVEMFGAPQTPVPAAVPGRSS